MLNQQSAGYGYMQGNWVWIQTGSLPGEAQLVGRLLDQVTLPGLLGTVAGDDTVLCISADVTAAGKLEKEFNTMLD